MYINVNFVPSLNFFLLFSFFFFFENLNIYLSNGTTVINTVSEKVTFSYWSIMYWYMYKSMSLDLSFCLINLFIHNIAIHISKLNTVFLK